MLRYSPYASGVIINACCVLHNICVRHGVPLDDDEGNDGDDIDENDDDDDDGNHADFNVQGRHVRNLIVHRYFNH